MAKEILDMVSKAESECTKIVADAKARAKQIEDDANAEAENIIKSKKESKRKEAASGRAEGWACDRLKSRHVRNAQLYADHQSARGIDHRHMRSRR